MEKGLFISLEGIDGSGKSTVSQLLAKSIKDLIAQKQINYNDVILTREPGGLNNEFAENVRHLILTSPDIDLKTQIMLFASSRTVHCSKTIQPNLELNNIVISDRFVDSSVAYQSTNKDNPVRNIELENTIKLINAWATNNFVPHITFYLDISVSEANKRLNGRDEENWLDRNPDQYFENVRQVYLSLAADNPNRIKVIDASRTQEEILEEILNHLNKIWN